MLSFFITAALTSIRSTSWIENLFIASVWQHNISSHPQLPPLELSVHYLLQITPCSVNTITPWLEHSWRWKSSYRITCVNLMKLRALCPGFQCPFSYLNQVKYIFPSQNVEMFFFPSLHVNIIIFFSHRQTLTWVYWVVLHSVEGCNGDLLLYMKIFSPESSGTKVQEAPCVYPGFSKPENTHPGGEVMRFRK